MELSRFHLLFNRGDEFFIYNSKTLSLNAISKDAFDVLKKVEVNEIPLSEIDKNLLTFLIKEKLVCTIEENDENFIDKLEYRKRFQSFVDRTLSLVIAPTLTCNFACPYCYEKDLPQLIMGREVEDGIINFIEKFKDTCTGLELCWDGGEPLIGFNTIKSLTEKIREKSSIKIKYQSIVTNGYLISPEICNFFAANGLNLAQITIDGSPETHNKTRILKNGKPTYERIIKNIDLLSEIAPQCKVIVRTNIHNDNKNEFITMHDIWTKRWANRNVSLVPAFVMQNEYCKVNCCTPREKSDFYKKLKEHGIIKQRVMPITEPGHCTATKENSYVISLTGNLYKCWNDIGMKNIVLEMFL